MRNSQCDRKRSWTVTVDHNDIKILVLLFSPARPAHTLTRARNLFAFRWKQAQTTAAPTNTKMSNAFFRIEMKPAEKAVEDGVEEWAHERKNAKRHDVNKRIFSWIAMIHLESMQCVQRSSLFTVSELNRKFNISQREDQWGWRSRRGERETASKERNHCSEIQFVTPLMQSTSLPLLVAARKWYKVNWLRQGSDQKKADEKKSDFNFPVFYLSLRLRL